MQRLNKVIDYCCAICFSISLIVLLGCLAVLPLAKSKKYYMSEHLHNNVLEILEEKSFNGVSHRCSDINGNTIDHRLPKANITVSDIEMATSHIIDYLYDEDIESMQFQIETMEGNVDFFSEQAIVHMADVKVLFIGGIKLAFTFLAIFLLTIGWMIYRRNSVLKLVGKTYLITLVVFIILTILVVIYASNDFDSAFILFHEIIFPDSNKVDLALSFNSCDTLTNVLTSEFFMHIGLRIGIIFLSLLVISVIIDIVLYKYGKKFFQKKQNIYTNIVKSKE